MATQKSAWATRGAAAAQPRVTALEHACRRVHDFASRNPGLYRCRVALLSASLLLRPFLAAAFLVAVAFAFPWAFRESVFLRPIYAVPALRWTAYALVYASWLPQLAIYVSGVVRALTLRLPAPAGVRLTEEQAPRFFRMLKDISRSLDAPAPAAILISPEYALHLEQGLGSEHGLPVAETVLVVGLPVLEALSPQQLRALVAHELAHLPTHERRFGGMILALRARLAALRDAAEASALSQNFWSRLPDEACLGILDGIIDRLTPATFPAVRQHETEADAIAAAVAGRDFAASALLRRRIASSAFSRQFRDDCMQLAQSRPEPPADLFDSRAAQAAGPLNDIQIHAWLREEMDRKDNLAETHPPLWDRLRMMGFSLESLDDFRALLDQVQPHRALGEIASRFFLGDLAGDLRDSLSLDWRTSQARDWRARYETYETLRVIAAESEASPAALPADPATLWQIALAIGNTRSWREARPIAERILELDPDHADANLLAGQFACEDGDPIGLELLERAMSASPASIPVACATAARFLDLQKQPDAAASYRSRSDRHIKLEESFADERSHARLRDSFVSASCPQPVAVALRHALELHASSVRTAYLVRKLVPGDEQRPLYVLGIERRRFLWENEELADRLLLERISRVPGLPEGVLVCVASRDSQPMLSKWKSIPDAVIFPEAAATNAPALREQAARDSQPTQRPRHAASLQAAPAPLAAPPK